MRQQKSDRVQHEHLGLRNKGAGIYGSIKSLAVKSEVAGITVQLSRRREIHKELTIIFVICSDFVGHNAIEQHHCSLTRLGTKPFPGGEQHLLLLQVK